MKTLTLKNEEVTVIELVSKIQSLLNLVNDGHSSQYLNVCIEDNDNYGTLTIRVSNHSANRLNNSSQTVSFVTDRCHQSCAMISNQYLVDDIEDMLTDETTRRGYLSVEEILEDLIEDFKF